MNMRLGCWLICPNLPRTTLISILPNIEILWLLPRHPRETSILPDSEVERKFTKEIYEISLLRQS